MYERHDGLEAVKDCIVLSVTGNEIVKRWSHNAPQVVADRKPFLLVFREKPFVSILSEHTPRA